MAQHAPWVELSKAQHVQTMMSETFDHARAAALAAREIDARVVTQVEHPSQLASVAYHDQGDVTLNTLQAWEQRLALRRARRVREALHAWWTTALQTLWHEGYCPADGEAAMLDEMAYKKIYMRVCHAMALSSGEEFNRTEAVACADEDWKADSHGGVGMPRELFMDAIFQMADIYTDEIDEAVYASFLERLLEDCIPKALASMRIFWASRADADPDLSPRSSTQMHPSDDDILDRLTSSELSEADARAAAAAASRGRRNSADLSWQESLRNLGDDDGGEAARRRSLHHGKAFIAGGYYESTRMKAWNPSVQPDSRNRKRRIHKARKGLIMIQSHIRRAKHEGRYQRVRGATVRIQARVRTSTVQSRFAKMKAAALTLQSRFRVYVQQRLYSSFIRRNRNSGGEHQHEESRPGLRESYSICNNVHAHVEQIRKAQRDAAAAVAAAEAAASGEMVAVAEALAASHAKKEVEEDKQQHKPRTRISQASSRRAAVQMATRVVRSQPPNDCARAADRCRQDESPRWRAKPQANASARTVIPTKMAPKELSRENRLQTLPARPANTQATSVLSGGEAEQYRCSEGASSDHSAHAASERELTTDPQIAQASPQRRPVGGLSPIAGVTMSRSEMPPWGTDHRSWGEADHAARSIMNRFGWEGCSLQISRRVSSQDSRSRTLTPLSASSWAAFKTHKSKSASSFEDAHRVAAAFPTRGGLERKQATFDTTLTSLSLPVLPMSRSPTTDDHLEAVGWSRGKLSESLRSTGLRGSASLPTLMERSLDATQQLQEDSVEIRSRVASDGAATVILTDRDLNQRALRTTTPSGRRIGDRLQTPHTQRRNTKLRSTHFFRIIDPGGGAAGASLNE